jgi:putative RNA-binding protein, YhbY family
MAEMNSKQRAALRAIAQSIEPIVYIGKEGISDNLVSQVNDALEARELIKCSVQQNSTMDAKEVCDKLCTLTQAHGISVLGRKFVLYRKAKEQKLFF